MFKLIPRLTALHEALLNGYHIVKSAKGYSLRNPEGQLLAYGSNGLWFEEYSSSANVATSSGSIQTATKGVCTILCATSSLTNPSSTKLLETLPSLHK